MSKRIDDFTEVVVLAALGAVGAVALGWLVYERTLEAHAPTEAEADEAGEHEPDRSFAHFDLVPNKVSVRGIVPSDMSRAVLASAAQAAFEARHGERDTADKPTAEVRLIKQTQRAEPSQGQWVTPCVAVLTSAAKVRWGRLSCSATGIVLTGQVPDAADVESVKRVAAAHAPGANVELRVVRVPVVDAGKLQVDLERALPAMGPNAFDVTTALPNLRGERMLDAVVPLLRQLDGLVVGVRVPLEEPPLAQRASLDGGEQGDSGTVEPAVARAATRARGVIDYLAKRGVDTSHVVARVGSPGVRDSDAGPDAPLRVMFEVSEDRADGPAPTR
jgi:hypothetical protein